MGKIRGMGVKFGIAGELISFLWQRKLWWMIPSITLLLLFGLLIILTEGSALAPSSTPCFSLLPRPASSAKLQV